MAESPHWSLCGVAANHASYGMIKCYPHQGSLYASGIPMVCKMARPGVKPVAHLHRTIGAITHAWSWVHEDNLTRLQEQVARSAS